jgi:hypothetical protein
MLTYYLGSNMLGIQNVGVRLLWIKNWQVIGMKHV